MPRIKQQPAPAAAGDAEAGAARLRAAEPRKSRRAVRSRRLDTDTTDHKIGQDKERRHPSTGRARYEYDDIEQVDRPVSKAQLEGLKFNEEMLTVLVHESTNPTDDPVPYVINGGVRQAFIRGKEQEVRRKFVEILARMKVTTYTQQKYKDSQDIDAIRSIPHTANKFPFTVIYDPNPRGRDWLKAILAEV